MEQLNREEGSKVSESWTAAAFLLKVSGGRHSGATMSLVQGRYSLGQDQDCDFIFLDDAFLDGRIILDVTGDKPVISVEGITKATVGGKPMDKGSQVLAAFEIVEVGATRFALGPAQEAWPEPAKPPPPEAPPAEEAKSSPDAKSGPQTSAGQVAADANANAKSKRLRLLAILSAAIPLVAAGVYFVMESSRPKPNPPADIRAIIMELNLPEVALEDSTHGPHALMVKGFVPTEADRSKLLARLSAYNPGIRSRIISAEETRGSVQGVLDLYGLAFTVEIGARGKAILHGVFDDTPRLKEILESVKQGVQSETEVEGRIVTLDSIRPYVNRLLVANQLEAKVRLEAGKGRLYGMLAKGKMEPREMEAWKTIKAAFKGQYGFDISDRWTDKLSPTLIKFALAAHELDSQLTGVTVGDLSHISLKKGGKFFEGGRLKSGPFIRSIQKDRIVLTVDGLEDTYFIKKENP